MNYYTEDLPRNASKTNNYNNHEIEEKSGKRESMEHLNNRIITFTADDLINTGLLPSRIDKILVDLSGLSRSKIQELLKLSAISVGGEIITEANYKLVKPSLVVITLPEVKQSEHIVATNIPLDIIFEDKYLLVINKPAGMTVHPGNGTHDDTLVNALLHYCGNELSSINGEQRPGIVHRIDRDTTGLLLIAKNDIVHQHLAEQIAAKTAERRYLALAWGMPRPMQGVITTQIGRSRNDRTKMTVLDFGGKEAITHYEVKEIFAGSILSLIECKLETGRTHQIRVHLSHIGHSVVGDQTYGHNARKIKQITDLELQELLQNFKRQALHAYNLSFTHPVTNERINLTIDLPEDFKAIYEKARINS